MTKNEIVERYLASIRYKRTQGDTFEPVAHIFILDVMFQVYCKEIAPYADSFKHEASRHRKKWLSGYTALNRRFFDAFTVDEQCEVTDIMEHIENYMHNAVEMEKIAVMNCFSHVPFEQRRLVASICLCNTLCHAAQAAFGRVYKTVRRNVVGKYVVDGEKQNQEIKDMCFHSMKFMSEFYRSMGYRDMNVLASDEVVHATERLARRIYEWIGEMDNQ